MAKGIRVNQLAKELGVTSKDILDKCRAEGLGEKVPNHMSVLSIGLSETELNHSRTVSDSPMLRTLMWLGTFSPSPSARHLSRMTLLGTPSSFAS